MKLLYSCIIAISMYSRIPMPQIQWTKERMKHALCFFPLVGLIQGLFLALWLWLAEEVFRLSPAMTGLWAAALPVLITGGIHMDGFLDTMDGVCSYGDREKKLEILKDPHLGAFAVIYTFAYMLLYAGASCEFAARAEGSARLLPVLFMTMERAFSGLSVLSFPSAKKRRPGSLFCTGCREENRPYGNDAVAVSHRCSVLAFGRFKLAFGSSRIFCTAFDPICLVLPVEQKAVWRDYGRSGRVLPSGRRAGLSDRSTGSRRLGFK